MALRFHVFILGLKSLLVTEGEMNNVECLILYTCGDYVAFKIRYALVKFKYMLAVGHMGLNYILVVLSLYQRGR